jgi:Family of unknown function (DUF6492)
MPGDSGAAPIAFFTPTFLRDIERFALLRRSIKLFAPTIPHIVVVNTEDYREFARRFGCDQGLELLRSAEVLPTDIERRRRKSGPRWLTGKWLKRDLIKGWYAQQLMKLFALPNLKYYAAVFMDSDVLLCRPLTADYFYVHTRLKLFRRRATNAEGFDFDISTHEIMGNPLSQVTELFDYIYSPTLFRRSTGVALFAELKRRSRHEKFVKCFLEERRPSEYNLLGYIATEIEGGRDYEVIECEPDSLHHSIRFPEDRAGFSQAIEHMINQPKPFALIQSTLGIEPREIAAALDRLIASKQSTSS